MPLYIMALNTWLNPLNKVSLTNLIDITADTIRLITILWKWWRRNMNYILDWFLMYSNTSSVIDVEYPLGGGLSYTVKEWQGVIDDPKVAGLQSLIDYLEDNYRKKMTIV